MNRPNTYEELNINIFKGFYNAGGECRDFFTYLFKDFGELEINAYNVVLSTRLGSRKLSNLVDYYVRLTLVDGQFKGIPDSVVDALADYIYIQFKYKWNKLKDINSTNYDALKPFNITLSETASDVLDTQKDKTTYTDNENVYGFNSPTAVPSDKNDGESNREYKRTIDNTRDYTRIGNIGNTSLQDLVIAERNVANFNLLDTVFKDISTIICRGKYI